MLHAWRRVVDQLAEGGPNPGVTARGSACGLGEFGEGARITTRSTRSRALPRRGGRRNRTAQGGGAGGLQLEQRVVRPRGDGTDERAGFRSSATDVPGIRERGRRCGRALPRAARGRRGLAEMIVVFARDPALRARVGAANAELMKGRQSAEVTWRLYAKLVAQALGRDERRRQIASSEERAAVNASRAGGSSSSSLAKFSAARSVARSFSLLGSHGSKVRSVTILHSTIGLDALARSQRRKASRGRRCAPVGRRPCRATPVTREGRARPPSPTARHPASMDESAECRLRADMAYDRGEALHLEPVRRSRHQALLVAAVPARAARLAGCRDDGVSRTRLACRGMGLRS